ncbi:hypothetical protein H8356DRAFT_1334207 [Neocallimastix lanati (nom. inval.)]|nr:hypothetical protein H8356DRAFT_1334207 [Neocallimastix sp. JGI-2020a]
MDFYLRCTNYNFSVILVIVNGYPFLKWLLTVLEDCSSRTLNLRQRITVSNHPLTSFCTNQKTEDKGIIVVLDNIIVFIVYKGILLYPLLINLLGNHSFIMIQFIFIVDQFFIHQYYLLGNVNCDNFTESNFDIVVVFLKNFHIVDVLLNEIISKWYPWQIMYTHWNSNGFRIFWEKEIDARNPCKVLTLSQLLNISRKRMDPKIRQGIMSHAKQYLKVMSIFLTKKHSFTSSIGILFSEVFHIASESQYTLIIPFYSSWRLLT